MNDLITGKNKHLLFNIVIFMLILLLYLVFSLGGSLCSFTVKASSQSINLHDSFIKDLTGEHGYPSATMEWEAKGSEGHDQQGVSFHIRDVSPVLFTGLNIGWDLVGDEPEEGEFEIRVRTGKKSSDLKEWLVLKEDVAPEENPTGIYWSDIYLTPGGELHSELEIIFTPPEETEVNFIRISVADASEPDDEKNMPDEQSLTIHSDTFLSSAPSSTTPNIITREEWWGSLPESQLDSPRWPPARISVTHAVVHHTATQNNSPHPEQVVRNIWHYHARTLEWGDIGYNFLIDQHGNIYQGRNNPWLYSRDTQAGHAYGANSASFGVSLMGQFHSEASSPAPGHPALEAIGSLERLIAWRFKEYNLDPLGSASINNYWAKRICGHRDVGITACPGDNLYSLLPGIRENVKELIHNPSPVPPQVVTYKVSDDYVFSDSAIIPGGVIDDGGAEITRRYFGWGKYPYKTLDNFTFDVEVYGDTFIYRLTGLEPDTTYYYRAWATNSEGSVHGHKKSFTTLTNIPQCNVSNPELPCGPNSGYINTGYTYYTGGSSCSCGKPVEYRFWWYKDEEKQNWRFSGWNAYPVVELLFDEAGKYNIYAQARCTDSQQESAISKDITVVVDKEPNWHIWEHQTIRDTSKAWTVKFSQPLKEETVKCESVYITCEDGNSIPVSYEYSEIELKVIPEQDYTPGETYTLWIKDLKSQEGTPLNENIKMQFTLCEYGVRLE